jgi:hypothetical protein
MQLLTNGNIDKIYHYIKDLEKSYISIHIDIMVFSFKRIKVKYDYCPVLFTCQILAIFAFSLMAYLLINIFIYLNTSINSLPSIFLVFIFSIIIFMGFLITPLIYSTKSNSAKFQNKYEIKMPTNVFIKSGLTVSIITFSISIIMAIINNNN